MKSHNPVTTAVNSFPVGNMELRKQQFKPGEIPIYDAAVIYMRGDYWQFRMWLQGEGKYARKSLNTRSESTAVERGKAAYLELYNNAKQGSTDFSITTKQGVALFIQRCLSSIVRRMWTLVVLLVAGWERYKLISNTG